MENETPPQPDSIDSETVQSPIVEVKPDDSVAMALRAALETGLDKLRKDAETVSITREQTDKARTEVEAQLVAVRESVAGISQQLEAARVATAELSSLSASTQSANNQSKETSAQAAAALESARGLAEVAGKSAGSIESLKAQVEQTAQVAAARSDHIEQGRKHADGVQAAIDKVLTQAQQSATNAEAQLLAARTSSENLGALYAAAQTVKANTDSIAESVTTTRAAVQSHAVVTKRLSEIAENTERQIAQYEAGLGELTAESVRQRQIIDDLLLGATNAGLASAWDKRGKTFKPDESRWQNIFIASLVGLFILAVWQAIAHGNMSQAPDWQELARMLVFKLPLLIPLVWLAIHAARQAGFAKRMEEEYAFKATTSMSFEGYRRQMAEIGKDLAADSPLANLCNNTLRTIAAPPGKVYDKQRMDPTPGTAAAELIGPIVAGVSKTLAAKIPDMKQ